jgi:hypothetical protein
VNLTYTADRVYTQFRLAQSTTCCRFSGTWPLRKSWGVCTCNLVRINLWLHGHSFSSSSCIKHTLLKRTLMDLLRTYRFHEWLDAQQNTGFSSHSVALQHNTLRSYTCLNYAPRRFCCIHLHFYHPQSWNREVHPKRQSPTWLRHDLKFHLSENLKSYMDVAALLPPVSQPVRRWEQMTIVNYWNSNALSGIRDPIRRRGKVYWFSVRYNMPQVVRVSPAQRAS